MRAETQQIVDDIEQALTLLRRHLDWDNARNRLAELNALVEDPTLWDDASNAQKIMRERQNLDDQINGILDLQTGLADNIELIEMGEMEDDTDIVTEAEASISDLNEKVRKQQIRAMLSGEADGNDTYVEIHSGAGGTESQDWASMLLRMYTRWGSRDGRKVEVIEVQDGEEAGIKAATILVKAADSYGWLKTESGVHRLVRISPFDSNARRHTSFASVWVYPVIDDSIEIDIPESDVRIDTYRASGAGGQHVNTTDSAVRITHIPSGVVVQCQNDRSQHKNRATAWGMLRSRLYEEEMKKREEAAMEEASSKSTVGWGHQIRSYVLQPYQLVKDLRTGQESTDPQKVLDGGIDAFLEASLSQKIEGGAGTDIEDIE
ncbi:MAG: peptide chain release factor 2 [Hyphomicrobiales bacterium]